MKTNSVSMFPVQSSQISYIGYDEDKSILYITFKNDSTFRYFDVEKEIYNTLKTSTSVGKYFNSIKNNYEYEKVK